MDDGYYDPECVPYLQPSSYCNYTRGHNRKLFKLQSHLDLPWLLQTIVECTEPAKGHAVKIPLTWAHEINFFSACPFAGSVHSTTVCNKNSSGDEIANVLVNDDIAHT